MDGPRCHSEEKPAVSAVSIAGPASRARPAGGVPIYVLST